MDENAAQNEENQKKCLHPNDKVICPPGKDSARYMVNCIKKGDRICYSDYKALIVRKELSSDGSHAQESEDSIHSGESLYKNLTFDLCLNDEENEKCLAFWKSVMEKNLKPIECTLLKPNYDKPDLKKEPTPVQNSKEELESQTRNQRTLSFKKRQPSNNNTESSLPNDHDIFQRVFNKVKKKKLDEMKLIIKEKCRTCGLIASMDENKILSGDEKLDRKHHLDQLVNKNKAYGSRSSSENLTKQLDEYTAIPAQQTSVVKNKTGLNSESKMVKKTESSKKELETVKEKTTTPLNQDQVGLINANISSTKHQSKYPICSCQAQQCECKHEIVNALKKFGDRQCCCGFSRCTCKNGLYLTKEETNDNSETPNSTQNSSNASNQIISKKQTTKNTENVYTTSKLFKDNKQTISDVKANKVSDDTKDNKNGVGKHLLDQHIIEVKRSTSKNVQESINTSSDSSQEIKPTNRSTTKEERSTKSNNNTATKEDLGGSNSYSQSNEIAKTSKTNATKKGSEKNSQGAASKEDKNNGALTSGSIGENFCTTGIVNDSSLDMIKEGKQYKNKVASNVSSTAGMDEKVSKTSSIRFSSDILPDLEETGETETKCPCGYTDCDCEPSKFKPGKKKNKKCICGCGHGNCQCEANKSIETILKHMEAKYIKKRKSNSSIVKSTDCSRCGCSNNTRLTSTNTDSSRSDIPFKTNGEICNCGFPDCDCVSPRPTVFPTAKDVQERVEEPDQLKANKDVPDTIVTSIGVQCERVESRQLLKRKYCYICGHYNCPCELRKLSS